MKDLPPSFEHSTEIARKVLPFLGQRAIPATPENYMIFYLYFEGRHEIITRAVDEVLDSGRPWDDGTTRSLFDRLFSPQANINLLKMNERLARQVRETTQGIMAETAATAEVAHQTSRSIEESLQSGGPSSDLGEMTAWLKKAVQQINQVNQASKNLGGSLQEKNRQLGEVIQTLEQMEVMALTDELTQLANRRSWEHQIHKAFETFRNDGEICAIIMIDVDNFKLINDRHGHQVGDQALKAVAEVIRKGLRKNDFAARYGGEEFVCLLPGTDLRKAGAMAEHLRRRLCSTCFTVRGQQELITASFGVACFSPNDGDARRAVDKADKAMYLAKNQGKNQVCDEVDLVRAGIAA